MPANVSPGESAFPKRGVPGGWCDVWDDPATATLTLREQAEAEARRMVDRTRALGALWRAEEPAQEPPETRTVSRPRDGKRAP